MSFKILKKDLLKKKSMNIILTIFVLLATMFIITLGSVVFGSTFSSAKNDEEVETFYTSIEIEKGESLWSIAKEYKPEDSSTQDYIYELMDLNNLTSDKIHEGQHLVVSYEVVVNK